MSTLSRFPQVSWSLPHKQASSGTYQVKFFDEESYSALRKVIFLNGYLMPLLVLECEVFLRNICSILIKCESPLYQAQRNNEDVNAIEPLFSVNIDHRVSHVWTLKLEQTGVVALTL